MTDRPDPRLHDPFGRAQLPDDHDRAGRVRLLSTAFRALLAGEPVPRPAALFLGAAGMAWLELGASFERDHLRVTGPRRSRLTPAALYARQLAAERCARTATAETRAPIVPCASEQHPSEGMT